MSASTTDKTLTHVIYALHALSFFFGITAIVAVVINYVKRSDVRGTWLASHFTWQIRTFWWGVLWAIVGTVGTFFLVGWLVLGCLFVWYLYRVIKGWLRLADGKSM